MKGRRPKPVEQKVREGNPGKRKLPSPLVLAAAGLEKPADLPAAADELWDDLVPILWQAGVLNRVDTAALTALCVQWHRSVQARQVLEAEGLFSLGSTGQVVPHPAIEIERGAHLLLVRFAEQFGITPVARARIAAAVAGVSQASMADELAGLLDD